MCYNNWLFLAGIRRNYREDFTKGITVEKNRSQKREERQMFQTARFERWGCSIRQKI